MLRLFRLYMAGPAGRPLRAGASVIDVTGGMFGVIGILALLERRHRDGRGGHVNCALFESTAFLVGQHLAQNAVTGKAAAPMPERVSAWAVYDVFNTKDGQQIFVAVVSDSQWREFCTEFSLAEFAADASLQLNNDRVAQRNRILPVIQKLFAGIVRDELLERLERCGVPAARIARPEDLVADVHLNSNNSLVDLTLPDGGTARLPALPVELDGRRCGLRLDLRRAGEDSRFVLGELGVSDEEFDSLKNAGIVS